MDEKTPLGIVLQELETTDITIHPSTKPFSDETERKLTDLAARIVVRLRQAGLIKGAAGGWGSI